MHKHLLDIPTHFETERLTLRPYQPGDGRWYYDMARRNQPHLARFEAGNPVMSIHSQEQAEIVVREYAAAWVARDAFFLAAFLKDSGVFVAQIYIGPADWELPEFKIGYFADVDHQGQGYVTEAVRAALGFLFRQLKAHRVSLECDDTNSRSIRVAERCGFTREGHFRQNKRWSTGRLTGTLYYATLRRDYFRSD